MSYVASVLAPDEQVRFAARLHWLLWLRAWLCLILLGPIIVGILMFADEAIRLRTTEVAITDRRLIRKHGLLARHARELELASVEAVNVDQDLWGRMFGFGRVEVHGTGDDVWSTPLIGDPIRFRRELEAAMAQPAARQRLAAAS